VEAPLVPLSGERWRVGGYLVACGEGRRAAGCHERVMLPLARAAVHLVGDLCDDDARLRVQYRFGRLEERRIEERDVVVAF
jgi:hypothetical protein